MKSNSLKLLLLVVSVATLLFVLLLAPRRAAWNSGNREELSAFLRYIGNSIAESNEDDPTPYTTAFIPKSLGEARGTSSKALIEQYGLALNWRSQGEYRKTVFYPVCLNSSLIISHDSLDIPRPLVVMVPLADSDKTSVPILHGCANVADDRLFECQLLRIRELSKSHGIESIASLMSDGSIEFVDIGRLVIQDIE